MWARVCQSRGYLTGGYIDQTVGGFYSQRQPPPHTPTPIGQCRQRQPAHRSQSGHASSLRRSSSNRETAHTSPSLVSTLEAQRRVTHFALLLRCNIRIKPVIFVHVSAVLPIELTWWTARVWYWQMRLINVGLFTLYLISYLLCELVCHCLLLRSQ